MTDRAAIVALTGGTGFVGRHFAAAARARGYRIRHLVRDPDRACPPGDDCHPFDLGGQDNPAAALGGCAALVHLAAHIPRDHDDPGEAARCWRINAWGTLRLVEAAAAAGVERIIQTTSANAYAPCTAHPDESAPLFPASRGYYLGSKILQEIYAHELCRTRGIGLATLRLASVYGAGQTSGAPGAMIRAALEDSVITVVDGGRFGADLVHVDDVAQALLLALERHYAGPLNVGSGERTTMAMLARTIADLTGARIDVLTKRDGVPDPGFPALDIGRLRALGCHPRPLSEGISSMIAAQKGDPVPAHYPE